MKLTKAICTLFALSTLFFTACSEDSDSNPLSPDNKENSKNKETTEQEKEKEKEKEEEKEKPTTNSIIGTWKPLLVEEAGVKALQYYVFTDAGNLFLQNSLFENTHTYQWKTVDDTLILSDTTVENLQIPYTLKTDTLTLFFTYENDGQTVTNPLVLIPITEEDKEKEKTPSAIIGEWQTEITMMTITNKKQVITTTETRLHFTSDKKYTTVTEVVSMKEGEKDILATLDPAKRLQKESGRWNIDGHLLIRVCDVTKETNINTFTVTEMALVIKEDDYIRSYARQ